MSKIGLLSEEVFEDSIDEQNEVLEEISEEICEGGGADNYSANRSYVLCPCFRIA